MRWIFVCFPESLEEHSLATNHKNVSVFDDLTEGVFPLALLGWSGLVYLCLWSSHEFQWFELPLCNFYRELCHDLLSFLFRVHVFFVFFVFCLVSLSPAADYSPLKLSSLFSLPFESLVR